MIDNDLKIGFVTIQAIRPEWNVSSTRFRVTWPARYASNFYIDDSEILPSCVMVVFQTRFETGDILLARELKSQGIKIVLDVTDPHWQMGAVVPDNLSQMINLVDMVTFPTEALKDMYEQVFGKLNWSVVADRIDLEKYREARVHEDRQEFVIFWHGSYGNLASLELARAEIEKIGKKNKLKLLCVYDKVDEHKIKPFKNIEIECREWSEQAVIDGLLESDISINPRFDNWKAYKSNNKTVMSWACGVPCIEYRFSEGINRYLGRAELRNKNGLSLRKTVENFYDVSQTAKEWIDIAEHFYGRKVRVKKNIVVYTSICGGFDGLREDQTVDPQADYVAFMDRNTKSNVWTIRRDFYPQFLDPRRQAKIFKILPWEYLDYEYSIWIDGSIAIKSLASSLIEKFLDGYDMAVFRHKWRDDIYDEYDIDRQVDRGEPTYLKDVAIQKYRKLEIPRKTGLWECGILIRRHTEALKRMHETWWGEISAFTNSDQIPLVYSTRLHDFKINPIVPGDMYSNPYFNYVIHQKTKQYSLEQPEPEPEPEPEVFMEEQTRGMTHIFSKDNNKHFYLFKEVN